MLAQQHSTTTAKGRSGSNPSVPHSAWLCLGCMLHAIMAVINMPLSIGAKRLYRNKPPNPSVDESRPMPARDARAPSSGTESGADAPPNDGAGVADEAKTRTKQNGRRRGKGGGTGKRKNRNARRRRLKGKNKDGAAETDDALRSGEDDGSPKSMMRMLASGVFLKLGLELLGGLQVGFSSRPNAAYGLKEMYEMLLAMCCGGEMGTAEGQYEDSLLPGRLPLPSRSWLFKRVGVMRYDHMLRRCRVMVRRTVLHAKRRGMLRHPVDVAIDEHDIPLHEKCKKMIYAVFSKGKKGTIRFNRLVTIYCIVNGQRLTLGVEVMRTGQNNADMVRLLIRECSRCGIRISSVTADRGFYSTAVMHAVRNAGLPFVMPAVKYQNIKDAIKEFDGGKIEAVSTRTMSSGDMTESFKLVILRRKEVEANLSKEAKTLAKLHKKEVCVADKYYVFATTMPDSWIGDDPRRVAEFYRQRWSIENSYKCEKIRPWTTSKKLTIRILLWFVPILLYNLWMTARFLTDRRTGVIGGRSPLPLTRFVSYMQAVLTVGAMSGRPPD